MNCPLMSCSLECLSRIGAAATTKALFFMHNKLSTATVRKEEGLIAQQGRENCTLHKRMTIRFALATLTA